MTANQKQIRKSYQKDIQRTNDLIDREFRRLQSLESSYRAFLDQNDLVQYIIEIEANPGASSKQLFWRVSKYEIVDGVKTCIGSNPFCDSIEAAKKFYADWKANYSVILL